MMPTGKQTVGMIGKAEPGWARFADVRTQQGTKEAALEEYARFLGIVRRLSPKPLLDLSVAEVEALDRVLLGKSAPVRVVLRMFYTVHKKRDLLDALPRQKRTKARRIGLDTVLMPDDVQAMIAACTNMRDRAILATLAATGGRINEVLTLTRQNLLQVNGGYQCWFGRTKVVSQERYSPRIEGVWKSHLDAWLATGKVTKDGLLFPSSVTGGKLGYSSFNVAIRQLAKRAGIAKPVNPHAFRHARVTWGIINGEDPTKLSIAIWGRPVTAQMNRYSHYGGLETAGVAPKAVEMPDVPAMPVPPVLATTSRVQELEKTLLEMQRQQRQLANMLYKAARHQAENDDLGGVLVPEGED